MSFEHEFQNVMDQLPEDELDGLGTSSNGESSESGESNNPEPLRRELPAPKRYPVVWTYSGSVLPG